MVEPIIRSFGEEPRVHSANLRKAIAYRGLDAYRRFCEEWLGWPDSLTKYLNRLSERIIWDLSIRNPHRNKDLSERITIAEKVHVAATLAWIKEIQKP